MGPGEYVLSKGDDPDPLGHFGLAAQDYAHSTAPNRRFADLVTQRVVKAMLENEPPPYTDDGAGGDCGAVHCRSGQRARWSGRWRSGSLRGTGGASGRPSMVSLRGLATKGRMCGCSILRWKERLCGEQGLDVGDTVNVTLLHTDPQHAFIDFGWREAAECGRYRAMPTLNRDGDRPVECGAIISARRRDLWVGFAWSR